MAAQAFVLLQAGYETTSSTVTFCLFELCRNRHIMRRLQAEFDTVLDGGREISYEALEDMHYLECCVDETLRIYPIFPVVFRVCTEPFQIPDTIFFIEEGTLVQIPLLGIQRDPRYYENPLTFDPDRDRLEWIETLTNSSFGADLGGYEGYRMGKMMIKMAVVELLSRHDFELISPVADEELELDTSLLMLRAKHDIKLIPRLRVR